MMIEAHTYKYDGSPHYSFPMRLVKRTPELWIVRGDYGRILVHHTKQMNITINNESIELCWPGRHYVISADVTGGVLRGYYCNIGLPPVIKGNRVEWVDLDLDVLVTPDLTWRVVDEDEFEVNSRRYGYPPEVIAIARQGVTDVIQLVEQRIFPFDGGVLTCC